MKSFKVHLRILVGFIHENHKVGFEVFKGGIAHGNAVGNVYNWGDIVMGEPSTLHQRGSVLLYFSNKNPSEIVLSETPPTMKTSLQVFNSSKPLFEALAKKFPDIMNKSEMQYIILQIYADFIQYKEYVILVHDVIWTLLGPYDIITSVDGEEDIIWHTENNKPVLHVLLVCLHYFLLNYSSLTRL